MNARRLAVVAIATVTLAAPVRTQSQAPFPATPPTPAAAPDFHVPVPKRITLANGLEVEMVPWGNVPMVAITLDVRSGNVFEKADEVWLADLTGRLMREGTTSRSAAAISEDAARMGGSLSINVGSDQTTVGTQVLSDFGSRALELVADVAQHPAFPPAEIPRLKADLSRELAVDLSSPEALAEQKFAAVLYGDHPYGRMYPTDAMIKGYTVDQVRHFYGATYGAGRARLYIVGRFDPAQMEAAARRAFDGWTRGSAPEPPAPKPHAERAVYLIDRPGAVQSTVIIGLPVVPPTSDDYIPLNVMDALLGGAFGSRITRNIREDKGYTYSPGSEVSTHYHDAHWDESADVTTKVTGPSIKEILGEIAKLQAEPPSREELAGIQNYVAGTYLLQNSSRLGITQQLAFSDLQGLPASWANDYVSRVRAVTPAQISELARKYLPADRLAIVVVGDRKVIEDQLKPFGRIVTPN